MGLHDVFFQTDYFASPRSFVLITELDPIKIAFPWIFYAFIGYIEVQQLNLLFDRIIGYKSLEILSIYAIGLFKNRSKQILQCTTPEQVEELFLPPMQDPFLETIKNYFLI